MESDKLDQYLKLTQKALQSAILVQGLSEDDRQKAQKLIDMAQRYYSDALHFKSKGNLINAFTAVNYAHAFLDAAALSGWLNVQGKSDLFMVD